VLENIKGRKKWDELLRELAEEYMKVKRDKVRKWAREY